MQSRTIDKVVVIVVFIALFAMSLSFFAIPTHAEEPSLEEVLNNLGFTNVIATSIETFQSGTYNATLYAEFAGYHDQNELSYYEINTSTFSVIFTGPEGGSEYLTTPITNTFSASYDFGLSMLAPEHRYFTETWRNPDGEQHAKVFKNLNDPNMLLIGFENFYGGGDRDYNDMVFSLQLQYYLNVVSPYGTPSGEGWYYNGTTTYASLAESIIDHGNGTRRVFTHWSGDASGTNYVQTDPIYMNQNKTAVANWKTQYYLTLDTNPSGITTPSGEDWYDDGTYASISTTELLDIVPGESRYKFVNWTTAEISEITDPSSTSTTVFMDKPKTVTANYLTQYSVIFDQTGLDATADSTVVTVDSVPKNFNDLPFSFWTDEGSTVEYSYSNIVSSNVLDKRFALDSITGPTSPITITDSTTVVGNYETQFYLTVTSPHDSPTPTSGWFDDGTSITASVTSPWSGPPDEQYVCTGWTGTGSVPACGTTTTVTFTIDEASSITWNWKTQYYLTVQTDPAGLSPAPAPSSGWHDESTYVDLTAPNTSYLGSDEYLFDYWDVDGASQGSGVNPVTVYMNQAHVATAHYELPIYTLTILSSTGGTTDPVAGDYAFTAGDNATVEAIPDSGYAFSYWLLDGSNAGSDNPITVLMDDNHTLQAIFTQITYQLTIISTGGGTTDPTPGVYIYASGTIVEVTAVPDLGWAFSGWSGDLSGSVNPETITMDGNKTVTASFTQLQYSLTVNVVGSGSVDLNDTGPYYYGDVVELTAVPDLGWAFSGWSGDLSGSVNPETITMDGNKTVTATITQITYTLTITTTAGGTTSPSPGAYVYSSGTAVPVTAIPDLGYVFDHWVLDGSPAGSASPINILMDSNHNLEAVFSETHTLIITITEGGTTDPSPETYVYQTPTDVTAEAIPFTDYEFDHWEFDDVNIGSENPVTVYVGSVHTLHAVFVYSAPPPLSVSISPLSASIMLGDSVTFTSTVTGGTTPYVYQWYVNDVSISGATSSSWTFDPTSSGIYYIHLEVTDANNNTVQSEIARITVSAPVIPVGGYSVSLSKNFPLTSVVNYAILMTILALALSLFRRKTK